MLSSITAKKSVFTKKKIFIIFCWWLSVFPFVVVVVVVFVFCLFLFCFICLFLLMQFILVHSTHIYFSIFRSPANIDRSVSRKSESNLNL